MDDAELISEVYIFEKGEVSDEYQKSVTPTYTSKQSHSRWVCHHKISYADSVSLQPRVLPRYCTSESAALCIDRWNIPVAGRIC